MTTIEEIFRTFASAQRARIDALRRGEPCTAIVRQGKTFSFIRTANI